MELIRKVSDVLMQSDDIHEILEKILDFILELLKRVDRGVVIIIDQNTRKTSEVIFKSKKRETRSMQMYSRTIVERVMRERKPVIMSDTFSEDEADRSASMELMRVRSVMCVPLISRSQMRGVIYVDSVNKPHGFRNEDLSLLTALSSSAAIAIENALLYANRKRRAMH
jgi:GAF domain-containing protein